ncbi:MAG TPA: vWA domain-containing protein [Polyangia bacterium]|nr:vWA domain-containing protein [Polyangia bacterium]
MSGAAGTTGGGNPGTAGSGNPGTAGNGGGGNVGPAPTTDANCGARTFGLNKVPPDVLIVQDRSGSMNDDVPMGTCGKPTCSKWDETTAALKKVVMATETTIRWGLKFFPESNGDQCAVGAGVAVPIADMNAAMIIASIDGTRPGGRTPTQAAERTSAAYLAAFADPNPKYILLATDGEPNCGMGGNASDAPGAVQAVTDVAGMGIPTFVVGIATNMSDPMADATLSMLATAGGRPRAAVPPYYPVTTANDLVAALSTIGGQISSCSFGLGSRPPVVDNIAVNGGGARIPRDTTHMNGWDYGTGQMSIILYGSYCDKAKAGQLADVQAIFGCPGIVIP